MHARDLLNELRDGGADIHIVDEGAIEVCGKLTDSQRAAIRSFKPELLQLLAEERQPGNVISLAEKRRETRRQSVVELAAEDGWTKEIYFGEPDRSYQDVVVIPCLKRVDGQFFYFEQDIPIKKWDDWKYLEMAACSK